MLPVRGTHFLIRLESADSHDVRDEGFSNTEFIITPNAARRQRRIPITAPRVHLGATRVASTDEFTGSFSPLVVVHSTHWNWSGFPSAAITRHPVNDELHLRSATHHSQLQPDGTYRFVGGITHGARSIQIQLLAWRTRLRDQATARTDALVAGGMRRCVARRQAENEIADEWAARGYPRHPFDHLQVLDHTDWECHHIHENSWSGSDLPTNLIYLPLSEHSPITNWFDRRRDEIKRNLGIR